MGVLLTGCSQAPDDLNNPRIPEQPNFERNRNGNMEGRRGGNGMRQRGGFNNALLDSQFIKDNTNGQVPTSRGLITKKEDNTFEIAVREIRNVNRDDNKTPEEIRTEMQNMTDEERLARREEMMNQNTTTENINITDNTVFAVQNADSKEFEKIEKSAAPSSQFGMVWIDESTKEVTLVAFTIANNNRPPMQGRPQK